MKVKGSFFELGHDLLLVGTPVPALCQDCGQSILCYNL
jgi:hypothetical protein